MNKRILVSVCLVFGFLLVACGTTEVTVNRNDAAPPATTTSPASAVSPATAVVVSGDKIGVPECDDFIAAYDACVTGKVPEVARAQYKTAIEQWRTSWKQLAANQSNIGFGL